MDYTALWVGCGAYAASPNRRVERRIAERRAAGGHGAFISWAIHRPDRPLACLDVARYHAYRIVWVMTTRNRAVKIPNAAQAIIDERKLAEYLLNPEHQRGGSKAALLLEFGYSGADWQRLERDLRDDHLSQEVVQVRQSSYGVRYEIRAPLHTPSGRLLVLRSIWQIDTGTVIARLITAYPD